MRTTLLVLMLVTLNSVAPAVAQPALSAVHELYAAADYTAALQSMESLDPGRLSEREAIEVARYRLLCLLALGRSDEARRAAHELVDRAPFAELTEDDASPSVRSKFAEWRLEALPRAAQARFSAGRESFVKRDYASATRSLLEARRLLGETASAEDASERHKDLQLLISGFLDLIQAAESAARISPTTTTPAQPLDAAPTTFDAAGAPATTKAPAPSAASARAAAPPRPGASTAAASRRGDGDLGRVFTPADPHVVAPHPINQDVPPWPDQLPRSAGQGISVILEVLVDANGSVESASVRRGVHPVYDAQLVQAVKAWRYRPASLDGKPVRFLRALEVRLSSP